MEVITFQSQVYQELADKLKSINDRLTEKEKQPREVWLTNEEFIKLLKISKRTAQHYRDTKMISFSQVGGKLYYRLADVEEMLMNHYNKAKHGTAL